LNWQTARESPNAIRIAPRNRLQRTFASIGHCHQTRSFIRLLDEGGMIWRGCRSYCSLDAALADAEAEVFRWMKDQHGITDAA